MKLSIITINYNDAEGLKRTLNSVAEQTYREFEHIIIDGGSSDGSVPILKSYEEHFVTYRFNNKTQYPHITCVSEKDNGIYHAMNKGIRRASGEYIQILNSGDILAAPDVTERMMSAIDSLNAKRSKLNDQIPILYGNMVHVDAHGKPISKSKEIEYSLRQYYSSTMNHDCCYIRRDLFEQYGLYDENLKIVSDWKWFLQAIGLGNVKPVYVNIDVTHFDMSGISERNLALRNEERKKVLAEVLPPAIRADYDAHAFEMEQMKRLRKYHLYGIVYFIERILFKLEKWRILK